MMKEIGRSKLQKENIFYLKYNAEGETKIVDNQQQLNERACYRQVHKLDLNIPDSKGQNLFVDQYQIDQGVQFADDDIIIKRLSNLYDNTNKPPFFSLNNLPTRLPKGTNFPHCIYELALFTTFHYKTLFITQDFSPSGKYILILNNNSRFEAITVDDRIPIDRSTLQPIWGLTYSNPWQLILIKAWAKRLGGFDKLRLSKPFEFVEGISNPTWRYYNIAKQYQTFLKKYSDFKRLKNSKIILKTKNVDTVRQNGLIPNSATYQIVGGFVERQGDRAQYHIAIKGTTISSWRGKNGYLDINSIKYFREIDPDISLERGFLMSGPQFINNFASAHITSQRFDNYYTGYRILQIEANERKAQHFQFQMKQEGFFDLSIKQFPENIIYFGNKQRESSNLAGQRYLKNKYILVRDNSYGPELKGGAYLSVSNQNQSGIVNSSLGKSNLIQSNLNISNGYSGFKNPRFSVYQIEYLKGYNKGQAHFINLPKGRYILRLKSQLSTKNAQYSINWVCSNKVQLTDCFLSKSEKVELLHDAAVSIMHKAQHYYLQKNLKSQMISYSNSFQEIGYGFIAVNSKSISPYSILLEVDPKKLYEQGYALKGKYKQQKQPFSVRIDRGDYESVVFKCRKDAQKYFWPSQAFKIWKKDSQVKQNDLQIQSNQHLNLNNRPSKQNSIDDSNRNKQAEPQKIRIEHTESKIKQQNDEWAGEKAHY